MSRRVEVGTATITERKADGRLLASIAPASKSDPARYIHGTPAELLDLADAIRELAASRPAKQLDLLTG